MRGRNSNKSTQRLLDEWPVIIDKVKVEKDLSLAEEEKLVDEAMKDLTNRKRCVN